VHSRRGSARHLTVGESLYVARFTKYNAMRTEIATTNFYPEGRCGDQCSRIGLRRTDLDAKKTYGAIQRRTDLPRAMRLLGGSSLLQISRRPRILDESQNRRLYLMTLLTTCR